MLFAMQEIRRITVFSTLGEEDLKDLDDFFTTEEYGKKDSIFSEGDPSDWLYGVLEGKVKITKLSAEGKEIILEVISPGDVFGAIAVMRGFPYPANAVAMEDTRLLKISRNNFLRILDGYPSVMYCMMQNIGDRMKGSHESLKNIALEKVSSRIAALLLKLSEKSGRETPEGTVIDFRLTKQDIADMVGTTVETSIRTMSQFKKSGIVAEEEGQIVIKDPEKLRALAY
jgi:CRP/FNR family transcriptional regulator